MTRQIQSPTRLLAVLAGIAGLLYLFCVGITGGSTASAASTKTPAPGSSCAHPWKVLINLGDNLYPYSAPGTGNSTHYLGFHWTYQPGNPDVTDTFTAQVKSVSGVKVRMCKFVGQLTNGRATSLTCTHPGYTTRGWNVASTRSTTCTVQLPQGIYIKSIYLTGARA